MEDSNAGSWRGFDMKILAIIYTEKATHAHIGSSKDTNRMCNAAQVSLTGTSSYDDILRLSAAYCAFICTYLCVFVYLASRGTVHCTHNPLPACQLLAPLKVFFICNVPLDVFVLGP